MRMMLIVVTMLAAGIFLEWFTSSTKAKFTASDECRATLLAARANVDGWIYVNGQCSPKEQDLLRAEFSDDGAALVVLNEARAHRLNQKEVR